MDVQNLCSVCSSGGDQLDDSYDWLFLKAWFGGHGGVMG